MKIELLKSTVVGGEARKVGDIVEVDEQEGKVLISLKRAKNLDKEVDVSFEMNVVDVEAIHKLLQEKDKEIEALKNARDGIAKELEKCKEDIQKMTLKDLREKYKDEAKTNSTTNK